MANNIVDRTTLTAAVDDDGTNTTGTTENKAWLASVLYDPIEAVVSALFGVCQGRLTLQSGTAISTADQTAKTTVYFTPYLGARIGLYDGSQWKMVTFSEISVSVPATTSTLYDVFVPYTAGAAGTPELVAWTNDTTRATALATQDGIYVKTGDATRRYVGSVRTTTVSGQTEDSAAKRYLWNAYNRTRRPLLKQESTATWTYTTAAYHQANGSTANQVEAVIGIADAVLSLWVSGACRNSTAGIGGLLGIGEDSTTVNAGIPGALIAQVVNTQTTGLAYLTKYPAVGRHVYAWLEYSQATGTMTWYGTGAVTAAENQSGIYGWIEG